MALGAVGLGPMALGPVGLVPLALSSIRRHHR